MCVDRHQATRRCINKLLG